MKTQDRLPSTLSPEAVKAIAEELQDLAQSAEGEQRDIEVVQVTRMIERMSRKPPAVERVWMRSTEAAEALGVSRNTVKKWARTGYLRGSRRDPDGWWHIPRASVEHVAQVEGVLDSQPEADGPLPWRS